jgi:hypothetical protein
MAFWIYENWQAGPHKAVIHAGACGYCKDGRGRSGKGTNPAYGRWLGPFETLAEAEARAATLPAHDVTTHRCCGARPLAAASQTEARPRPGRGPFPSDIRVTTLQDPRSVRREPTHAAPAGEHAAKADSDRIGLVGCVKSKLPHAAPAGELYISALFAGRRAYVERTCGRWFILSAEYGLLAPEREIEPYEKTLKTMSTAAKRAWSRRVAGELLAQLGTVSGLTFEVHAGHDYFGFGLRDALLRAGAAVVIPTEHLKQGEQLSFYGRENASAARDERRASLRASPVPAAGAVANPSPAAAGFARELTQAFMDGAFDLSARPGTAVVGWEGVPEMPAAARLRDAGASDAQVRLFLTLTCAMDRARDANRLWDAAARLFLAEPAVFEPTYILAHRDEVGEALQEYGVSQRHGPDLRAWATIAASLAEPQLALWVHRAVFEGSGDAKELLRDVQLFAAGAPLFPMLKGPKVGPMWVRMLAYPGGATLSTLAVIPVAVDTHVRRASEFLGVADTQGLDLGAARPLIQAAWLADVAAGGAAGPTGLANTCAALDPALWFFGKYGCSHCASLGQRMPVASVCETCQAPF